jgi:hypothetical protein
VSLRDSLERIRQENREVERRRDAKAKELVEEALAEGRSLTIGRAYRRGGSGMPSDRIYAETMKIPRKRRKR